MPNWDFIAPVAVFAFAALITPGPNNVVIAATGVNFGFARSFSTIAGVVMGFAMMALVVAFGLGGALAAYPTAHQALRFASLGFMIYLAWKIARAGIAAAAKSARPPGFWRMVAFQWVNPKAWAMATGATAGFTTVGGDALSESVVIALVFCGVSWPCQLSWGIFGAAVGGFLRAHPFWLRVFNVSMAVLMLGVFAPFLFVD